MRCQQSEALLQKLLDERCDIYSGDWSNSQGPNSDWTDSGLFAHLEECDACAELAAAYDALAHRSSANSKQLASSDERIPGLANRVLAEALAEPSTRQPAIGTTAHWKTWGAVALAASLLLAVGLGLRHEDPSGLVNPPLGPSAESDPSPQAEELPVLANAESPSGTQLQPARNMMGQEVWYRTGRGLASISLTNLRLRNVSMSSNGFEDQPQFFHQAVDALRQIWPPQGEAVTPNSETGWYDPASPLVLV